VFRNLANADQESELPIDNSYPSLETVVRMLGVVARTELAEELATRPDTAAGHWHSH
jgi:hypothetical protein